MLFILELKILEEILKDGVKEMLSHVSGKSRDAKKRPWVKAIKAAVDEYQRKVKEDFLPVLANDFGREVVISFTGGKISGDNINKIKIPQRSGANCVDGRDGGHGHPHRQQPSHQQW